MSHKCYWTHYCFWQVKSTVQACLAIACWEFDSRGLRIQVKDETQISSSGPACMVKPTLGVSAEISTEISCDSAFRML